MRSCPTISAFIASAVAFVLPAAAAPMVYVDDENATLALVNLSTGAATVIGTLPSVMTDIALAPSGELYGVDFSGLWRIDIATAQGTRIGNTGYTLNALTFGGDGTLYAAGLDTLMTVDTGTGLATSIGRFFPYASAGDLAFDSAGHLLLTTTYDSLIRLDPLTASPTFVGNLGHTQVFGLAMADGTLFGISDSERVSFAINPATGATGPATALPSILAGVYGTTAASNEPVTGVVPEPAALSLGAVLTLLMVRRRR